MRTFYGVLVYIFHPNTARIVLDFIFRVHAEVKSNESQSLFWIIMVAPYWSLIPNPEIRFFLKKRPNLPKIRGFWIYFRIWTWAQTSFIRFIFLTEIGIFCENDGIRIEDKLIILKTIRSCGISVLSKLN